MDWIFKNGFFKVQFDHIHNPLFMIKRTLISVSDKDGIVEFASKLHQQGVEILSTGGTAKRLRENNIPVTDVSEYTQFPEMMNGRVKTLHPKIHGALLALRESEDHMHAANEHGIQLIDLLVVNLYPFESTIQKEGITLSEAIEQIDIGGPSMLRSAAKNYKSVTVVTDPADYGKVIEEIQNSKDTSIETRRRLAEKVFEKTAAYDAAIASYLNEGKTKTITVKKITDLRYGENPHQKATWYQDSNHPNQADLAHAEILQGKALSYNNLMDADGALSLVREFKDPCVAFIKHANPCGIAIGKDIKEAFMNGYAGDSRSAFGGIIAFNRTCTAELATEIVSKFFEVILAPDFEEEALEILKQKEKMRVLKLGKINSEKPAQNYRKITGGLLIQDLDTQQISEEDLKVVTQKSPSTEELKDLLFAWHVCKHVKSNAIVLAKNGMTVGIGAGQMSRVDAAEIAINKSQGREKGSVMASDAFFPFADSIEAAAQNGITAIIQPGGSIRDEEVIAAADEHGIAMVFTGTRAFLH